MSRLLLLLAAVVFANAAPKNDENEMLQILSRSPEKLRAIYRASPEEGIQVVSEVNLQNNYVSISTLDGVPLVSARFSTAGSGALWKILGYNFFLYNNTAHEGRSSVEQYLVPPASTGSVEKEIKSDHFTTKLFRSLETDHIDEAKHSAFSELFSLPELGIIFEMSEALGEAGVNGYDNPAALNFHGLALHFAKLMPKLNGTLEEEPVEEESVFVPRRIGKRATCTRNGSWGRKIRYSCSRCPSGSNCFGMCGRGCNCWRRVCGHCCHQRGCHDHDACCRDRGFLHHRCLFPHGFSCSGYSC